MSSASTTPYRIGDLLALARRSWIAELSAVLAAAGYPGYRRSDAAAVRLLQRGSMPVGRLAEALGVTRQAARKLVTGLERRGLAQVRSDPRDARRLDVGLTADGEAYARAIVTAIARLDRTVARRVTPEQLAAADAVLRAVLGDEHSRAVAARVPPPGAGRG